MTIAVAALCLLVQVMTIAHLLLVQHDVCAAHGEVIHEVATHAAAMAPAIDDGDASRMHAAPPATSVADDDHCRALGERRDLPSQAAPDLLTRLAAILPAPRAPALPAGGTRPLYRLAPKISPPRAA